MPGIDLVHLAPVVGGLRVERGARDLAYPVEAEVRLGVVYGYAAQFVGELSLAGQSPQVAELSIEEMEGGVRFVIAASDDATVNSVHVRPLGDSQWQERARLTGSGVAEVLLGEGTYWAYVRSESATGSAIGAPRSFGVFGQAGSPEAELRRGLRERALAIAGLAGTLASPEAAYYARLPVGAELPCLVFTQESDAPCCGGREFIYEFRAYARAQTGLERILRLLRGGMGGGFQTASWSVRSVEPCGGSGEGGAVIDTGSARPLGGAVRLRVFAYENARTCRFGLGETELLLPAPGEDALIERRAQAAGEAMDGTLYVYDRGRSAAGLQLEFAELTAQECAGLNDFFHHHARARQHEFSYTDTSGQTRQVRFAGSELVIRRKPGGVHHATVELALSPAATD